MRFVKYFSTVAALLNELTKKDVQFEWCVAQQNTFDELKRQFINALYSHFLISLNNLKLHVMLVDLVLVVF
jgi:hypothetical protein